MLSVLNKWGVCVVEKIVIKKLCCCFGKMLLVTFICVLCNYESEGNDGYKTHIKRQLVLVEGCHYGVRYEHSCNYFLQSTDTSVVQRPLNRPTTRLDSPNFP